MPAGAIEAIPETPGWRGFVIAGAGYVELRSNFVSGNDLADIGNPELKSLGARPARDEAFLPVITGEINYTFGRGWPFLPVITGLGGSGAGTTGEEGSGQDDHQGQCAAEFGHAVLRGCALKRNMSEDRPAVSATRPNAVNGRIHMALRSACHAAAAL